MKTEYEKCKKIIKEIYLLELKLKQKKEEFKQHAQNLTVEEAQKLI